MISVGTKVRIRKDLKEDTDINVISKRLFINMYMIKYRNELATIKEINNQGNFYAYRIDIDNGFWLLSENMFSVINQKKNIEIE